jgi:hypothetical protein
MLIFTQKLCEDFYSTEVTCRASYFCFLFQIFRASASYHLLTLWHQHSIYVGCNVMLNHTECHIVISAPKHPPFQSQSSADHWIPATNLKVPLHSVAYPGGVQTPSPWNSKVLTKLSRNSSKVPKIKKILLYEMKFRVPNYSCLQDPWLGGYHPQIPILSVLNWICWTSAEQYSWVRHCLHFSHIVTTYLRTVVGKVLQDTSICDAVPELWLQIT